MSKVFSVTRLTIGNKPFKVKIFSSINNEYQETDGSTCKIIKKRIIKDRWITLYLEERQSNPRPETVFNLKKIRG